MKKRILSLLLLLAMLVTMIPVATVAAEETAQTEENTAEVKDYDYYDLYVQDALKALHTAFDVDDETIKATNNGNGKWLNRVEGGNDAALGGGYWRTTANGGIGYDLYRGSADDADGTNYVDEPTVDGEGTNTYKYTTYFQFGANAYAHEDFTVEYVAEYLPIYTRLTGETAVIGSKVVGEAYTFNEAKMTTTDDIYGTGTDYYGYLCAFTGARDGRTEKSEARGAVRWMAIKADYQNWNYCRPTDDQGIYRYNTTLGMNAGEEIFHKRGGIYTFAVMADETTENGKNEATYTLLHDRAVLRTATVASYTTTVKGEEFQNLDYNVDSTSNFRLSHCLPTDFYVVRMYHKVLSVAEQAQNHVVDVLEYYNLAIDKTVAEKNMGALSLMLGSVGFEKDAIRKDAVAKELQAKLENAEYNKYNIVTDGLVAYFSAQGEYANTVDLAKGTWTDLYAGNVATLKGKTWKKLENGFVGFNIYRGQADADGSNYVDQVSTNNYWNGTERLELGIALLPEGDYTVEYMAEYKPIYTLLTGTTDEIVGEAFDFNGANWEQQYYNRLGSVEALGYLTGWTTIRDALTYTAAGAISSTRGGLRWIIAGGAFANSNATALGFGHGMDLLTSLTYRSRGKAHTEAITRSGSEYQIIEDAAVLKTSTGYADGIDFSVKDDGQFYLSDRLPTDFYSLRIYNRALSAEELMRNALVDKALFYGITLPEGTFDDVDAMKLVNAAISAPSSSMSAQEIKAQRLAFETLFATLSMYVTDGMTAFFSTNPVFGDNVDIAAGTWTDFYAGNVATLKQSAHWHYKTNGFLGFNLYRGQADADGSNYVDDAATNNYYNKANPTRLQLDISLLPQGDYTVDYMAEYRPVYTLLTGTTTDTISEDKIVGEAYELYIPARCLEQYWHGHSVEALGYLTGWACCRDTAEGTGRSGVRWHVDKKWGSDTTSNYSTGNEFSTEAAGFRSRGMTHAFAITRDVNLADGANEATYSIIQDTVVMNAYTQSDTTKADFTVADSGRFYLSDDLPTDFYALRIYNRVLSEAELLQNALADKVLFYGIELAEEVYADLNTMKTVNAAIPAPSSSMGAQEIEAQRLAFETLFATLSMYVTDGMTAFFSTNPLFGDNVDLSAGTWTDFFGGAVAKLQGSAWKSNANGFVGFDLYRGTANADGTGYVDEADSNTYWNTARLDVGLALLPVGDFTVEYTAEFKPIYTLNNDGSGDVVAEAYDYFANGTVSWNNQMWTGTDRPPVNAIGHYTAWSEYRDGPFTLGGTRGTYRYAIKAGTNYNTAAANRNSTWESAGVYYAKGGAFTFTMTRDVFVDTDEACKAEYTLYRGATQWSESYLADADRADFTVADTGSFYLSDRLPTYFFALRIYNRVLTEAEMQKNMLADKVLFYGLELPEGTFDDEEKIAEVNGRIPAPSSSMSAQEIEAMRLKIEELLNPKMLSMYVTDGMTAFFSTQGIFKDNVDIENGLWTDFFGGNVASLKGKTWTMDANGFVGFDLYRGQADADGTNYVDDAATNYYYWATSGTTARLDLGLALLPKGDFTVDYVAEYKPIYTLLTGTTADNITESAIVGEAFDFVPSGTWKNELYDGGSRTAVDYIGYLSGWTAARDGKNSYGNSRGGLRYGVQNSPNYSNCTGVKHGLDLWSSTDFRPRGAAHNYAFTRVENITDENNSAVYQILQDNGVLRTSTGANADVDFKVDDSGYFYLSDWVSTDFYALRIYDRALSVEELQKNAVADRILYYGIELSEEILNGGEKVLEAVNGAILSFNIETDAAKKAETKLEMETAIEDAVFALSMDDLDNSLYVQEGLTAIFTAFRGQSKYVSGGQWIDRLSGEGLATLKGATWSFGKSGGIGFNIYRGQADDAAGTNYVDSASTNNYNNAVSRLEFDISLLPKGDFTVDYLAEYKPIYTLKTGTTDEIVGEAYDFNGANWTEQYWNKLPAVDDIGYLEGWTTVRDGVNGGSLRNGVRYAVATTINSTKVMTTTQGLDLLSNASFRPRGTVNSYSYTRVEDIAGENNQATYSIWQNGSAMRTATIAATDEGYFAVDFKVDDTGSFYLSDRLPTDFYALRIYDRALSDAELQMNRLADLLNFYRITLADELLNDGKKLTALAAAAAAVPLSTDKVEAAGAALTFKEIIAKIDFDDRAYGLYVQDGLLANYTALNTNDVSAVLESGTWTNRVEGGPAAIFDKAAYWTKNANGSVGFTLYRGMIDAEGNYTDESAYNTYQSVSAQLRLDASLITKGDFTVEYVAEYKHLLAVDADGNPVRDTFANGDNNGVDDASQVYNWGPVDRIGYLNAFTGIRDGYFQTKTLRGNVWWMIYHNNQFDNNSPTDDNGVRHYFTYMKPVEGDTVFHKQGGVFTFAITRSVNLENGKNEATYSLLHDNVLLKSATTAKVEYTKGGISTYNVDFNENDPEAFYLSNRLPTDFYALRVYNRTLSYEEHLMNHFADIAIYYELTLSADIYSDANFRTRCVYAFATAEISADAVAKIANKKAYQKLYDDLTAGTAGNAYNYDELYVQNGLVALYSAFEGDTSVSPFNGTWANKVQGSAYGAATIRNSSAWKRETVGYGYNLTYDRWKAIGMNTGISLPGELENLDDFTVEAFATVTGITNEDGSRFVNDFVRDAAGNPMKDENDNWLRTGAAGGDYVGGTANFRFGLLTNLFFPSIYAPAGSGSSLSGRWYLYNKGYPAGAVPAASESVAIEKLIQADDPNTTANETLYSSVDDGWRTFGPDAIPTAGVMHVEKVTGATSVSYAISYGCSEEPMQSVTVSLSQYDNLLLVAENEKYGAGRFSLFNAIPATIYAIRVYNRSLSAAEKLQNNFVDKAGFYGLNLDAYKALAPEKQALVHLGFAGVGTDLSREEADSILKFYVENSSESINSLVDALVTFSEYLPITAGAYGYRALFTPSLDVQTLLEANGYKVFYGAIVAPGGKHNTLDDLTVTYADGKLIASAGKLVQVAGEGLTPTFYGFVKSGDDAPRYSAAVTASDASYFGVDMLVRGYAAVVAPDGTVTAAYDVNEQVNGSMSILEAADYYVNAFVGPVDVMYKYINSAALRHILAASGVEARVDLTADLVLYVDAENGSDANSGLVATEAYATIKKAFDAAKAHLAKTGRKGVTIQLAEGTYHITEALSLSAEEIKADSYYLNLVGSGETTVLTSVTEINRDDVQYDGDIAVIQLPGVTVANKTVYPDFRALYGDGELLDIAHFGGDEDTYAVRGAYTVDAQGNVLPKDPERNEQWMVSAEDAKKVDKIVFKLPYDMFADGESEDDYIGAELHWISTMRMIIMPIDHIVYADDYVEVFVDYDYFLDIPSFDYPISSTVCFLENSKGTLLSNYDTYYYDSVNGVLYFNQSEKWVEEFESFGYAAAENAFVFDGLKNVTVTGMTITGLDSNYLKDGTGMYLSQSAMAYLRYADGTEVSDFAMTPAGILGQGMTDLVVNNVVFRDTLGAGIVLKGITKNAYIDSNVFRNLGDTAIRLGYGYLHQGSYTIGGEITNNLVTDIGNLYNTASGITVFTAADLLVAGNTVANVPYSGFTFGWAWSPQQMSADTVKQSGSFNLYNVEFAYNYVTDYLMSQRDGGAIYTLGGYDLSLMGTQPVNFMHHNYVNFSYETGLLQDERWSVFGYYHDFGVTNWHNYENVLINTMGAKGSGINPVYLQNWEGTVDSAHIFEENYYVGYNTPTEVFSQKATDTFTAKYYNSVSDYIYASVDALENNTSIGDISFAETGVVKASKSTAANDVAAIFAAAGSTLPLAAEYKESGLSWTAEAAERVLVLDDTREISGDLPVYKITFTNGDLTTYAYALEGATLTVPTLFVNDRAEITYYVNGEAIDPATYVVPAEDITVDVTMVVPSHNVTFTDGQTTVTVSVEEGAKLTLPAEFILKGYKATFTMGGVPFNMEEYVMGDSDLNISVRYEKLTFRVTFRNALGESAYVIAEYGAKVSAPTVMNKTGYTNKYAVDGASIDLAIFTVPENNVTIDVDYDPIPYKVTFLLPDNVTTFTTIKTPFETDIILPDIAVGDYVEAMDSASSGYRYKFVGWEGYTEGMKLTEPNNDLIFVMIVEAEEKAPFTVSFFYPDGTLYDSASVKFGAAITAPALAIGEYLDYLETDTHKYKFNGWEGYTDGMTLDTAEDARFIMAVIEEEKVTEPEGILGDIDGNGVVEGIDITLLIQIASGVEVDPELIKGEADIDGNGVVEGIDITLLIQIASGIVG